MRLLALFIVLFVIPSHLVAQNVTVRAGEHEEFTRVVLRVPDSVEWSLGRTNDGYGLEFSRSLDFDLSEVFLMIPKDRLGTVDVNETGNQLNFGLVCDCFADAFLSETGWLVIDFATGSANENSRYEAPIFVDEQDKPSPEQEIAPPPPQTEVSDFESIFPIVTETIDLPSRLPDAVFRKNSERAQRLAQLEEAVSDSLLRAVDQGLLLSSTELQSGQVLDGLNPVDQLLVDVARLRGPGVSSRTSLDLALSEEASPLALPEEQFQCPEQSDFEIGTWGTEEPFSHQIAKLRSNLIGEFDRPNSDAIEQLARLYIFFGFGREAKAALRVDGNSSTSRETLNALAEILDGDPVEDQDFIKLMQCSGALHFWGTLAHESGPFPYTLDEIAIAATFRELPFHLQGLLGSRVAAKLRRAGRNETARIVLDLAQNTSGESTEIQIEAANQSLAAGEKNDAIKILDDLSQTEAHVAPAAFIQLLRLKVSENEPISESEITELKSIQFEQRDTEFEFELNELEVDILLLGGDFGSAMQLLRDTNFLLNEERRTSLLRSAKLGLVETAENVVFLNSVLDEIVKLEEPEIQNKYALRLVQLGFLDQAASIIAQETLGDPMIERRHIRAEIAIINQDFDQALKHLADLETEKAIQMRSNLQGLVSENQSSEDVDVNSLAGDLGIEPNAEIPLEILIQKSLGAGDDLISGSSELRRTTESLLNSL